MMISDWVLRPLVFVVVYGAYKGLSSLPSRPSEPESHVLSQRGQSAGRALSKAWRAARNVDVAALRQRYHAQANVRADRLLKLGGLLKTLNIALRPTLSTELRRGLVLIVGLLLIAAMGDWPYNFYVFLRILVTGMLVLVLIRMSRHREMLWLFIAGLIALIFNPIAEFRFDKAEWRWFDWIGAVVLSVLAAVSREGTQGSRLTRNSDPTA